MMIVFTYELVHVMIAFKYEQLMTIFTYNNDDVALKIVADL